MRYKEFATEDIASALSAMIYGGNPLSALSSQGTDTSDTSQGAQGSNGSALQNFKSSGTQVDPNQIKAYLKSKGFDDNQVAGWLVNIKWESSFKPGAYVASDAGQGQSGGFFGFHDVVNGKGLFTQMVQFTGGGNKWQTNWQGQLDFALQDPRGQQYKSLKFSNPAQAAQWWVINYEKPANTQGQAVARAKEAHRYA